MITRRRNLVRERKVKKQNIVLAILIGLCLIGILVIMNMKQIESGMAQHIQTEMTKNNPKSFNTGNEGRKAKTRSKKQANVAKPNYNAKAVKPVSPVSLAKAYQRRYNYNVIGKVAVPNLGINLNIYEGIGNLELNLGAGTLKRNQKMGHNNYALAGHNMDDRRTYFSPLYSAKQNGSLGGQTAILTDFDKVYYYRINEASFINSFDVSVINNSKAFEKHAVVTLITCDATGAGRLCVRGKLIKVIRVNAADSSIRKLFGI